jgi:hypothetical protein
MKIIVSAIALMITGSVFAQNNTRALVSTATHGEGLPRTIGTNPYAEEYRQRFMDQQGISEYERLGLKFFRGNSRGLGLIKRNNQDEPAFTNILRGIQMTGVWTNGSSFIKQLEDYTSRYGCIPKITSTSHGWRSDDLTGEVHGLSGYRGFNGIYARDEHRPRNFDRFGTRTIETHMRQSIQAGKIRFCQTCVIQIYACNVSAEFANVFAQVSGCQTVTATGQGSPYFQKMGTAEERAKTTSAFHYWSSTAATWAERGRVGWHRVTPVKNNNGQVVELIKENLGGLYIAL